MAKRFYDTGLPDQLWYQKLSPKCKALYIHLLCKCDIVGAFEINYRMFSAYIGEPISEEDVFTSFGNRVIPFFEQNKGLLVDFVYFQCGGELNANVKAHLSVFRRLQELGLTIEQLQSYCTHELKVKNDCTTPHPTPIVNTIPRGKTNTVKKSESNIGDMFCTFYAEYPRHDSKQTAILKFEKIMRECKTDSERDKLLTDMLSAIQTSKQSDQWLKDGGKFIPMPATWLNQRRWEDEGTLKQEQSSNENKVAGEFVNALRI